MNKNINWSIKNIIKEAKKYNTYKEWRLNSSRSFNAAKYRKINKDKIIINHFSSMRFDWSKNKIINEAKKFNTRKEWRQNSIYSYNAARYYGFLNDIKLTSHFVKSVLKTKWTKDKIIQSAKKYKTRKDWRLKDPKSYSRAKSKKFSLTQHPDIKNHFLPTVRKDYKTREFFKNSKWTKFKVLKYVKKFKTVGEWKKNNNTSYKNALKFGYIDEAKKHMPPIGNRVQRCVYSIKIKGKKEIYIGLTYNLNKRLDSHFRSKRFQGYKKNSLIVRRLSDYIDTKKASLLEIEMMKKFQDKNYYLLNKASGGGVGGSYLVWTKEKIINTAKKFNNVTDWKNSEMGAYLAARQNLEIFKIATNHFKRKKIKWNKNDIVKNALKFNKKISWIKAEPRAYASAYSRGWLKDATQHMEHFGWSKDKLTNSAKKFKVYSDWYNKEPNAYNRARKNKKLFKEITSHFLKKNIKWNKQTIMKSALKFKSKKEWYSKDSKGYRAALRFKILDKIKFN